MAFCTLYYGNGLLEDHPDRWPGRFIHYQGGLVLVQPVAGLLHRLDSSHQLQRLPCAVVCQTYRPGSERPADVWTNPWVFWCNILLCWHGVHLYWRRGKKQGYAFVRWIRISLCRWCVRLSCILLIHQQSRKDNFHSIFARNPKGPFSMLRLCTKSYSLKQKWCSPMVVLEHEHTWPLGPEAEPFTLDTTDHPDSTDPTAQG